MRTRPLVGLPDQSLLHSVGEEIAQSANLGGWFLGDENGSIAALYQRASPAVQPSCFLREIGVEVAHEGGELIGVLRRYEKVVVVGKTNEGVNAERMTLLSPCQ